MKRRAGFTDVAFPPTSSVAKVDMALDLDQFSVLTEQIKRPPFKGPNTSTEAFCSVPHQNKWSALASQLGSCLSPL